MAISKKRQQFIASTGLATVLGLLPALHFAGDARAAEGLTASFTISERLEYVDEEGSSSNKHEGFRSITGLGFALQSEGKFQRFEAGANAGLAYGFSNDDDRGFENPSARLSYAIESRHSAYEFSANYRRSSIDESAFVSDDDASGDIASGDGRLEVLSLRNELAFGREASVSGTLAHSYGLSKYSDTTDPSLRDNSIQALRGQFSFEMSPTVTTNLTASLRETNEQGSTGTDRSTRSLGVGVLYALSEATSLSTGVSYNKNESRSATGRIRTQGLGYSVGLTHERPLGPVNVKFSEEETINGRRRQASVGHDFEFQRGTVSLSFGLAKTDSFKARPLANATVNYEVDQVSALRLSLSQTPAVNSNDSESINTRMGVNYDRELTELSSLSAGLQLVSQDVLQDGGDDKTSLRMNLQHNYDIGDDWSLASGYEYSSVRRSNAADRNSNKVFLGLAKTFSFRP